MSLFSLLFRWVCFYTNTRHRLYITETLQKLYAWRKPIRPYAFIRVHNEIKTIDRWHQRVHSGILRKIPTISPGSISVRRNPW